MERIESDVLVVGTGGAGLRAAIEAEERGASVAVVSKAPAGVNNATMVIGGGFRAAVGGLTSEEHKEDTIRVGFDINDRAIAVLCISPPLISFGSLSANSRISSSSSRSNDFSLLSFSARPSSIMLNSMFSMAESTGIRL